MPPTSSTFLPPTTPSPTLSFFPLFWFILWNKLLYVKLLKFKGNPICLMTCSTSFGRSEFPGQAALVFLSCTDRILAIAKENNQGDNLSLLSHNQYLGYLASNPAICYFLLLWLLEDLLTLHQGLKIAYVRFWNFAAQCPQRNNWRGFSVTSFNCSLPLWYQRLTMGSSGP